MKKCFRLMHTVAESRIGPLRSGEDKAEHEMGAKKSPAGEGVYVHSIKSLAFFTRYQPPVQAVALMILMPLSVKSGLGR